MPYKQLTTYNHYFLQMRQINIIYTVLFISLSAISLHSQNVADAVRWSLHNPGGTARTLGVGGAFGAMGGDFSVININPAGIGEYAKGEFMFTPSINFNNSNSFLRSDPARSSDESSSTFKIDNIGVVISNNPIGSNWTHSNWAIGFSKISDLNKSFYFEGATIGSITEEFAEYANGKSLENLDDFRAYPAYAAGAIYDVNGDNFYETDFQEDPRTAVEKSQYVDQTGYINELALAWGGKYNNKMNLGFSIGVPFVSFEETKIYNESDPNQEISFFDELQFTEYLNTSGAGVNFKAGFVYEISKILRLGGALHSPTWYTLNDDYYTNLEYEYTVEQTERLESRSPDGSFRYQINSPWKIVGSVGSIYRITDEIVGFIDADVEWLDYGESSVDFTEYSSDPVEAQKTIDINREITQFLGQALNVRIGSELGYRKFRLRVGYESTQSAFNADTNRNNAYSFGVGLREDNFFIDLGLRIREYTEGYLPYIVLDKDRDPVVNVNNTNSRFLITAGFKF